MKQLLIILIAGCFLYSCKKDQALGLLSNVSSLNVINAIPGSSGLVTNINNRLLNYRTGSQIAYGNYKLYNFAGGSTSVVVKQIADTINSVYTNTLNLPGYTAHSLFLSGTAISPDTLLVEDHLTPASSHPNDSVTHIRFVNLLVGSNPVSINIQGSPAGSVQASQSYKAITGFTDFAATSAIPSYVFEFRDAGTGALLKSYTLTGVNRASSTTANTILFKYLTIVLDGRATGSPDPNVFLVNNF